MSVAYRPSHADYTYDVKYGIRAVAGGGRSSARETIGRVAAGAVAKKLLSTLYGTEVLAYVNRVKDVEATSVPANFSMDDVEANIVRCPDQGAADKMIAEIDAVRVRGESCGGEVTCVVRRCPLGLGAPVFDKLEADLAKAMLVSGLPCFVRHPQPPVYRGCHNPLPLQSLPATKGFEIGSGFSGSKMLGSEHNDEFFVDKETGMVSSRHTVLPSRHPLVKLPLPRFPSGAHPLQPVRWCPGRNLERGGHRYPNRFQADQHHRHQAEHGDPGRRRGGAPGQGKARPLCCPSGSAHGGEHGGPGAGRPPPQGEQPRCRTLAASSSLLMLPLYSQHVAQCDLLPRDETVNPNKAAAAPSH